MKNRLYDFRAFDATPEWTLSLRRTEIMKPSKNSSELHERIYIALAYETWFITVTPFYEIWILPFKQ
jgi:hypothetical protein